MTTWPGPGLSASAERVWLSLLLVFHCPARESFGKILLIKQVIGQVLSNYLILRKTGPHGLGQAFLARHVREKHSVILKLLPPAVSLPSELIASYGQQVAIHADLAHIALPLVREVGQWDGRVFVALEYFGGSSLSSLLKGGPLPNADLLETAVIVADVLVSLHGRGIIHGGLGPQSVFLTDTGEVKVLDAGLQPLLGGALDGFPREGWEQCFNTSAATGHFSRIDEFCRGWQPGAQCDLLCLGALLRLMATGAEPAVRSATDEALGALPLDRATIPLSSSSKLPSELAELIDRLFAREPSQRSVSIGEVRLSLERIRDEENQKVCHWPAMRDSRRRIGTVGLVFVVLILGALSARACAVWKAELKEAIAAPAQSIL